MFSKLLEQIKVTELADQILEKYKRVETDESYTTQSGSVNKPIATLADEYGGRAQVGVDDNCFVLYLLQEDGAYKRTAYIFPEAHEVLKDLPDPRKAQLEKGLELQKEDESIKEEIGKKPRKFECQECGRIFTEDEFVISSGPEVIISCPNDCIIGTVYVPDICDVKEIKEGRNNGSL